jgi:arsenite-transporting ATPase
MSSITDLLERKELKFVFVGGKGGVGKTTTSSAIAIQFSYDRKVLLLSTDPAHSLSDAFRLEFSGEPTVIPGIPNLSVMEVNPETTLQTEIAQWAKLAAESGFDEIVSNVQEFQEWLSGVPGIDEATALSNVIGYVESGEYDTIVFDTAPTGHTLKLLQMPQILQIGLDKLNSWQSKLWGYWSAFKGALTNQGQMQTLQAQVAERLTTYKLGIEKIGVMLKDRIKTNFVVVCIAEHLSVNESQRLLRELVRHQVEVSHVVVNQLVTDTLEPQETAELEALLARANPTEAEEGTLLRRMRAALQLTNARRSIQQKYLQDLATCPEVTDRKVQIVQMPLLASEVTGPSALLAFSLRLVPDTYRASFLNGPAQLEGWIPHPTQVVLPDPEPVAESADATPAPASESTAGTEQAPKRQRVEQHASAAAATEAGVFQVGDKVTVSGLTGATQYNGCKGRVVSAEVKGRYSVIVSYNGTSKKLGLKPTSLTRIVPTDSKSNANVTASTQGAATGTAAGQGGGMFDAVLNDPEVVEKLKIPKFKQALDTVKANPMAFFQYMGDPEIGPFISKMMKKMNLGGGMGM